MNILITGVAGFIGMAIAKKVLERGDSVIGIDNLNSFYDLNLKKDRLKILKNHKKFKFYKIDILSTNIEKIFKTSRPHIVLHLAAQRLSHHTAGRRLAPQGLLHRPFAHRHHLHHRRAEAARFCCAPPMSRARRA